MGLYWDVTADFAKADSYKLQDVYEWIDIVLNNVYLTQNAGGPTFQQVIGVPMGGKCSAISFVTLLK